LSKEIRNKLSKEWNKQDGVYKKWVESKAEAVKEEQKQV
jgi:hypothetical protein